MDNLLKQSDRIILIVGLCIGCIAFAHPQLAAVFNSVLSEKGLEEVNGERIVLENVMVKTPELIKKVPRIDLNEAGVKKLKKLPGVGPVLAERIVEHRNKEGRFVSVEELNEVSGIGPATLKQIKEEARVGS